MTSLSNVPTTTFVGFPCPECAQYPARRTAEDRCEVCGYAYPLTYVVPYDHSWGFTEPFLSELQRKRGLRLLGRCNDRSPDRLKELVHAEYLYLSRYPSLKLEWLAGFARLRVLELDLVDLSGLEGIEMLASLSVLCLTELRRLRSLAALRDCHLRMLRLGRCNHVEDYSPIGGLTSLQRLDIMGTELQSIDFLGGLTGVRCLNLAVGRIRGDWLETVAGMPSLRSLGVRRGLVRPLGETSVREALSGRSVTVWP